MALVQATQADANGATYSLTGGTACYAEFGMTGPNSSTAWQTCMFPAALLGCQFGVGDGTGGTETLVGDATSPGECAEMVQAAEPTANGATYSATGGTACYAEIGMTGLNGSAGWQTCIFDELELCTFTQGDGTGNPTPL